MIGVEGPTQRDRAHAPRLTDRDEKEPQMSNVTHAQVSRRRFGELDVAVLHAGLLHIPPQPAWRMEGSGYSLDDEGRPITGINGLLVKSADAVILIDPNSWEHGGIVESKMAVTFLAPGPPIDSLAAVGVNPEQVTHVVITHGHWDHYSALTDARGAFVSRTLRTSSRPRTGRPSPSRTSVRTQPSCDRTSTPSTTPGCWSS